MRAEELELVLDFVAVALQRKEAGAGSALECVQAELAREKTRLEQSNWESALSVARSELAALLGVEGECLPDLSGSFYHVEVCEGLAVECLHPILLRLEAEERWIRADAERARSLDAPDVTLGCGYRYAALDEVGSFIVSASFPLNFTRRGQAESAACLLRADAVRSSFQEAFLRLQLKLDRLLVLREGALEEVTLNRDHLLPKALEAYALSRAGYEAGRLR